MSRYSEKSIVHGALRADSLEGILRANGIMVPDQSRAERIKKLGVWGLHPDSSAMRDFVARVLKSPLVFFMLTIGGFSLFAQASMLAPVAKSAPALVMFAWLGLTALWIITARRYTWYVTSPAEFVAQKNMLPEEVSALMGKVSAILPEAEHRIHYTVLDPLYEVVYRNESVFLYGWDDSGKIL